MIQAKDLRIGNYIKDEVGLLFMVSGLPMFGGIQITSEDTVFTETTFNPIPLTEEWLVKFGFENGVLENEKYEFKLYFYDCWNISYVEKSGYGGSKCHIEGYFDINDIQNIFYLLSGEELTLKQ